MNRAGPVGGRVRPVLVLLSTLLAASSGGALLWALQVPGGVLVGAILGVGALSLFGVPVARHPRSKQGAQLLVGTGIGATLRPDSFSLLATMAAPIAASIVTLVVVGVLCGALLARTTRLDLATALAATAPGGMIEMVLVSDEVGADGSIVAGMHLLRILAVLGALPLVLSVLR